MITAKKKVLYTKIEAVYGTDSVPVEGANAMLVSNFKCTPIEAQYVERNTELPFFGNQGQIKVGDYMKMEYDVEIAGAGGVAVAPAYGPALRGCALSETITPVTGPVTYGIISAGAESVTKYFKWDGLKHVMLGARGVPSLKFPNGAVPMIHMSWTGLYGGITDDALGTPVLTGFQKPVAVNKANTTFSLHGYAAPLADLSIDYGTDVKYINRPNQEEVRFSGHKVRGSVTIEIPSIATKDYFSLIRASTTGALALVHGTAAGNKVLINAPAVQLTNPQYSEADGVGLMQMTMEIQHTAAGNDEITYATQ